MVNTHTKLENSGTDSSMNGFRTLSFNVSARHGIYDFHGAHSCQSTILGRRCPCFQTWPLIQEDGDLLEPAKGTFLPWSSGPRICPGIKMAQVEFATAFCVIFREYTIKPVLEGTESFAAAQERLTAVMMDSLPQTTLQLNNPGWVKLR